MVSSFYEPINPFIAVFTGSNKVTDDVVIFDNRMINERDIRINRLPGFDYQVSYNISVTDFNMFEFQNDSGQIERFRQGLFL